MQVISRFFVAQGGLAAQSVPIARLMKETTLRAERSGHMQVSARVCARVSVRARARAP